MPNEYQYDDAARRFQALSGKLHDESAWAPSNPSGPFVNEGPIGSAIDDRCQRATRLLVEAANELHRLAEVCRRRAEVCRQHRFDLQRYNATPDEIREHLRPPIRPASWVDL